MPKLKVDHVVSFSSEDPAHPANNVLDGDPAKKWLCQNKGERQATIVLQLEKASIISSIDIGNESSAYIEVLVSRSGSGDSDDYKVFLVMSAFMTPVEARQNTNPHKVRMFVTDQLSKPECEQKWDRIKVVCTQPFNRHIQYGLSFITFRTPDDRSSSGSSPLQGNLGKFTLRPSSPDIELSAGSLFARLKQQPKETLKGAAAIREASSSRASPKIEPKKAFSITPKARTSTSNTEEEATSGSRNRNELLYSKDEEAPNEKIDKLIERKLNEKEKSKEEACSSSSSASKTKTATAADSSSSSSSSSSKTKDAGSKRKHRDRDSPPSRKKAKDSKERKPFRELMRGVTLVISGIQNPDRGDLRSKVLEMGGKYKPDWDNNTCTHLICAFQNTPKFNQVKGKGKIVKRTWIEECHSQRKRLPWRRFALDKADAAKPESEDEIWEEEKAKPKPVVVSDNDDDNDTDIEGYDYAKMDKKIAELQNKTKEQSKAAEQKKKDKSVTVKDDDIYTVDTDEEDLQNGAGEIEKKLPNFLENRTFFVDETLDEDVCKLMERYVIAYNGIVAENPIDVDIFITSEDNVENLRGVSDSALFLRPDWLWECHNLQKFVPTDDYKL